jgi:hypothetical protein
MIWDPLCNCLNFNSIALPARVGMGLGGQEAATTASDATPNGEALAWAVVVGLGFPVVEDRVEGVGGRPRAVLTHEPPGERALRRTKAWPPEAVEGIPCRALAMRRAKGLCSGSS